jgi:nucleoside-diphosphate kinase
MHPSHIDGRWCCARSNIMHGSDSVDSANHEIGMWFTPAELIGWTSHSYNMLYE